MSWKNEYKRRCLKVATSGSYNGNGDEPDVAIVVEGEDGYNYSSYTYENAAINVRIQGTLRDGQKVSYEADGPEDVADFIRKITA
ncbi:hypothetical protein ACFRAQ_34560 [Nocardia sp. NPDC056611]|uniref:hypothetical protein n=1 Tax=Nocardia sp. NPDC056611 TaxID=3345877 RepID=UPI00366A749C